MNWVEWSFTKSSTQFYLQCIVQLNEGIVQLIVTNQIVTKLNHNIDCDKSNQNLKGITENFLSKSGPQL